MGESQSGIPTISCVVFYNTQPSMTGNGKHTSDIKILNLGKFFLFYMVFININDLLCKNHITGYSQHNGELLYNNNNYCFLFFLTGIKILIDFMAVNPPKDGCRFRRQSPQLAVYVDRSLSQYDRNDLAVALEAGHGRPARWDEHAGVDGKHPMRIP